MLTLSSPCAHLLKHLLPAAHLLLTCSSTYFLLLLRQPAADLLPL
jgi:hypothetical protein